MEPFGTHFRPIWGQFLVVLGLWFWLSWLFSIAVVVVVVSLLLLLAVVVAAAARALLSATFKVKQIKVDRCFDQLFAFSPLVLLFASGSATSARWPVLGRQPL